MLKPTASLTVRKILPCRPPEAFRAWTEPALFQQWFIPVPGMRAIAEMDLRRGGKYRIMFQRPAGELRVIVDGEFLAIESPTYLEYTWIWAEPAAPGEPKYTVVKVSFRDLGDERTEIVLTHEGFVDPDDRDDHTSGWTSILDHLASALGTTRPGA